MCSYSHLYACVWVKLRYSLHHGPVLYLVAASFHLGRRTPLCHSGWHMERQPPAHGVQKGSPPCHCLSLRLCPPSCPHAGRSREGGAPPSRTVTDWQVTGEASQTESATDTPTFIHIPVWLCVWMCASIQTHTAALLNTTGMWLQGHFGVEMTPSETFCMTSWTAKVSI